MSGAQENVLMISEENPACPVNVFLHYLRNLSRLIEKAEIYVGDSRIAEKSVLAARLADDMFPLAQQISTAVGFSLRALCPLAQVPIPELDNAESYAQLKSLIQRAADFIQGIPPEAFDGFEQRKVTTRAGFADHHFSGRDFLNLYALPNFFFHYSMVYAILRANGVSVGKRDFDGFHNYPPGFIFSGQ